MCSLLYSLFMFGGRKKIKLCKKHQQHPKLTPRSFGKWTPPRWIKASCVQMAVWVITEQQCSPVASGENRSKRSNLQINKRSECVEDESAEWGKVSGKLGGQQSLNQNAFCWARLPVLSQTLVINWIFFLKNTPHEKFRGFTSDLTEVKPWTHSIWDHKALHLLGKTPQKTA